MGTTTGIEWTDSTFNPWIGCTNISPGCDHCYAEAQNAYRKWTQWGPRGERRRTATATWKKPREWNADAKRFQREHGRRQRVFCASLADVFDNQAPNEWRTDLFCLIRECSELDWQLLTKRPQNIAKMLPSDWGGGYPNVWLGSTMESQAYYDQRWPILSAIPAAIRFISYEPAIGPLRLRNTDPLPDWLISGGESGPHARIMRADWARNILDDCQRFGVFFFHKQWGTLASNPLVQEQRLSAGDAEAIDPIGKGGKLLDGKIWHEFPKNPA